MRVELIPIDECVRTPRLAFSRLLTLVTLSLSLGSFLPCHADPIALGAGDLRLLPAAKSAALREELRGRADSCRVEWTEPYYYLWEWAQPRCEATRCELGESQTIASVAVVLFNYGAQPAEKNLRVFLLADAGGVPGEELRSIDTTTTLLQPGETRAVVFTFDPPAGPFGPGPIWFGHEETTAGPPSSLFDGVLDGDQASSTHPCGNWMVQDLGDYLQYLPVAHPSSVSDPLDRFAATTAVRWRTLKQPARGVIRVELELARSQAVTLSLFSLSGRRVEPLLSGEMLAAGVSVRNFDAERFPSGIYLLRLETRGERLTRKVLVLH